MFKGMHFRMYADIEKEGIFNSYILGSGSFNQENGCKWNFRGLIIILYNSVSAK